MKPLTIESSTAGAADPASLGRAHRLLWLALVVFLIMIVVGLSWDAWWHITREFDTFFAPPHLFIYATSALATVLVAVMVFSPDLRRRFGPGVHFPLFPAEAPGALVILFGGFVLQAFAGLVFDNLWHSSFGLDETGWSFPHAMLGWTFFITLLGFVACRLALQPGRPLPWYTAVFLGFLVLGFSATPFLGPLYGNNTPEKTQAIASIPVLLNQVPVQRLFRIYLNGNLTRTNPLFLPLGAIWAGAALRLVRGLDKRARVWLMVAFLWWILTLLGEMRSARDLDQFFHLSLAQDPASWLPPPVFPAALVLGILLATGLSERWAFALAGWVFGILALLIWKAHPLGIPLVILAGPMMMVGALIGERIYHVVEKPTQGAVLRFLSLAGLGMPFLTGLVDLWLRRVTP